MEWLILIFSLNITAKRVNPADYTVGIPRVTHFFALKSCVTQGMSVRFRDIPRVTHVSRNCVSSGKFNAVFWTQF